MAEEDKEDPSRLPGVSFLQERDSSRFGIGQRAKATARAKAKTAMGITGPPRNEFYTVIQIGTPPQQFLVAVDTGSGNIVVPSRTCKDMACRSHRGYDRFTSTSAEEVVRIDETEHHMVQWPPRTGMEMMELYFGKGSAVGLMIHDDICLGPPTPGEQLCAKMNFVSAEKMSDEPFNLLPYDGVLGLALPEMSATKDFNIIGEFAEQEVLSHDRFAVWLAGPEDGEDSELTLGDFKTERLASGINWVKVTRFPGAKVRSGFWQVEVHDCTVDNTPLGLGSVQAAADTGTTFIAGPSSLIGTLEAELGMSSDCSNYDQLPVLGFIIEGMILNLEKTDYVMRTSHGCHYQFMAIDLPPPKGPLLLLGDPFLRKYYTVYDRDSLKVGFALAKHKTGDQEVNLAEWASKMMIVH